MCIRDRLGAASIDQQAAQKAREKLKGHEKKLYDKIKEAQPQSHNTPDTVEPGDLVYLRKLNQRGQVLGRPNHQDEVLVRAGIMKLTVRLKDLELLPDEKVSLSKGPVQKTGAGAIAASKAKTMANELDLRGMLVDEEMCIRDRLHPGRAARITVKGKEVGFLGEIDPRVGAVYDVDQRLQVASLDAAGLFAVAEPVNYRPLSKYPDVTRDLAVAVDQKVTCLLYTSLLAGNPPQMGL